MRRNHLACRSVSRACPILGRNLAAGAILTLLATSSLPIRSEAADLAPSGAASCGVFVATTGSDVGGCGGQGAPCRTVNFGIARAVSDGANCVFIQAGTYPGVVIAVSGIDLNGGYDTAWQPGPITSPAYRSALVGAQDFGGDGEYLTVRAHSLAAPVTLRNLVLVGPNAVGTVGGRGRTSYALHASAATVTLEGVRIEAGTGSAGAAGLSSLDAVIVDRQAMMNGNPGGNGNEFNTVCDNTSRGAAGPRGTNTCSSSPSGRDMDGGIGGAGGTMDTDCNPFSFNFDARPGLQGANADYVSAPFGQAGSGGNGCFAPGGNGQTGAIANGVGGLRGSGGVLSAGYWAGNGGSAGGTGQNGSGGGGGGGSGGCDDGTDAYGAGGGGGGAGGCAARGGGGGGGAGGASFGVTAVNGAVVTLNTCTIVRGNGGSGGAGGSGGRGQSGGLGGPSGAHPGTAAAGSGGAGAHGGHGGGGGGGDGGPSYAILRSVGSTANVAGLTVSDGSGGSGGTGGPSAPAAPVAEQDGNDGQAALAGSVGTTLVVAGAEPSAAPAATVDGLPASQALIGATCDITGCLVDVPGERGLPAAMEFSGLIPNPLQGSGSIHFALPNGSPVRIDVFDATGRRVVRLSDDFFPAGAHAIAWDGTAHGRPLSSGHYVLRFEAAGRVIVRRAVTIR